MSAPATQNNTPNGTNSQQSSSKGRGGNSRSNTPVDANRGEGDANYQGKQNQRGNPEYKKGWRQKNATETAANGQGQAQGQGGQDRRKGKDRAPEQGGNDPNLATANGDRKYDTRERRPDRGGRRRDKDFNNQAQVQQQEPPAQPQQPLPPRAPQVDQARVEESRRISSLISTAETFSQEQIASIKDVARIVEGFSEPEICRALKDSSWDQQKAVNLLVESALEGSQANSWSDVVRKQRKEQQPAQPQPDHRTERTSRPPREPRQHRANGHNERQLAQQAPQQHQDHQQQAHLQQAHIQQQQVHHQQQQLQQQQQHHQQHQQFQQQQQHYQFQQQQQQQHILLAHQHQLQQMQQQQIQQIQVFSPAEGEALIMGLSKAIGLQLDDIAKKSKLLLEMQSELESIHAAGKEQLDSLQAEKSQLLTQRDNLQEQLAAVSERLVVVDRSIDEAEKEKLYKLKAWQSKSANHGLITNH